MWFNPIISRLLNSPFHGFISKNMMLMTYTGRKSGKAYSLPMNYLRIRNGDGEMLYTQSYRDRHWWRNLRNGATVNIHLQGKNYSAVAEVVEDERQVARELELLLIEAPNLARYYQVKMDENGQPQGSDLARAAQKMVVVKTVVTA